MPRFLTSLLLGATLAASSSCNGERDGETTVPGKANQGGFGMDPLKKGGTSGESSAPASGAWRMPPGLSEAAFTEERKRMVAFLSSEVSEAPIRDQRVLDALLQVPRHEFVPVEVRDQSYNNSPLPIPENQTISQPYIVALMTQLLELKGSEKVLEIGTGSGYQAAVLGELADEVYTVEIVPALLETAKKKLEELKERGTLHYKKIVAVTADGSKGYPPGAPYDAIIVTAAPRRVPVELLNQLKPGGRLVIPVGDLFQELQRIRKKEDGSRIEEVIVPVRFVKLRGEGESGKGQ